MMRKWEVCVVGLIVAVSLPVHAEKTLLDVSEDVSARQSNRRDWVFEYEVSDPLFPGETFQTIHRVREVGTGINYISGYDEEMRPVWEKTVPEFVLTGGGDLSG